MKSTHYRGYDLKLVIGNADEFAVRVYRDSKAVHEFECGSVEKSETWAREWIDRRVDHHIGPGDFICSEFGGYWCGIVVEPRSMAYGKHSVPGYIVRMANGELDWIGAEDAHLIAPSLDESEAA